MLKFEMASSNSLAARVYTKSVTIVPALTSHLSNWKVENLITSRHKHILLYWAIMHTQGLAHCPSRTGHLSNWEVENLSTLRHKHILLYAKV